MPELPAGNGTGMALLASQEPDSYVRQDEDEDASKGWRYNRRRHRYRLPNGRFASTQQAREYLDGYLRDVQDRNARETERYYRGEIGQDEYLAGMRQRLRDGHITARAMGVGGRSAMSRRDLAAINQHYKADTRYAHRLAALVEAGEISEAEAVRRSKLYAGGRMRRQLDQGMRDVRGEDGWEQGRRVLQAGAKHCSTCLNEAAQGWLPINRCGAIGATDCQAADRCYFDYRYSPHKTVPSRGIPWPDQDEYRKIVRRKLRQGVQLRGVATAIPTTGR